MSFEKKIVLSGVASANVQKCANIMWHETWKEHNGEGVSGDTADLVSDSLHFALQIPLVAQLHTSQKGFYLSVQMV